jgi:hypothetical protein
MVPDAVVTNLSGQTDYIFETDTSFVPDLSIDDGSVIWSPAIGLSCTDCITPTIDVTEDIAYTITVTSETGCTTIETVTITLDRSIEPIIEPTLPNVFSPIATDPLNRAFYLRSTSIDTYSMTIYDRWGSVVFTGNNLTPGDADAGWQGDMGGRAAVQGVYVYQVTYEDRDGRVEQMVGTVAVLR